MRVSAVLAMTIMFGCTRSRDVTERGPARPLDSETPPVVILQPDSTEMKKTTPSSIQAEMVFERPESVVNTLERMLREGNIGGVLGLFERKGREKMAARPEMKRKIADFFRNNTHHILGLIRRLRDANANWRIEEPAGLPARAYWSLPGRGATQEWSSIECIHERSGWRLGDID